MSEWIEKRIDELCSIQKTTVNPSRQGDAMFCVYSLPAFDDKKKPEKFLGKEIMSGKFSVRPGMILYNKLNVRFRRIWYIGKEISENSVCSTEFLPLVPDKCDQGFIYYYLCTQNFTDIMDSSHTGTSGSHQRIDVEFFKKYPILIPIDITEQQDIAGILKSLDDKIDLLMRQNATLEALAQTYFRQWFYEGDSAMTVSEVADLKCVSVNPAKNPLEPFYHYSIPAYDNGKTPAIELGKEILSNKYIVQPNSILVSKLNPITPRIWLIGDSVADNSVCSTEFQVLLPKDSKYQLYLYCLMNSYDVVQDFAQSATGTSGSHQRIRPEQIVQTEAVRPDETLLAKFNELCLPMFDKISKNSAQILTLQKLRDTLLPKLISGEVRIKQSEVL